jgi:hypothetical protein
MTVTLSQVLSFFHIDNFPNASEDEAIFLYHLFFKLCVNAKVLAREAGGKSDRVLHALMSALPNQARRDSSGHISAVSPAAIAGVTRSDECTRQKL